MGSAALFLLPTHIKQPHPPSSSSSSFLLVSRRPRRSSSRSIVPVARLFGPAIFEASKLKVLFLGVDEEKHPGKLPRTYTLTHSDITSKLTLAVSDTINRAQLQGWYNRLQRDEVVAEWKKVQGRMSLHVHCHISGGHFLLDLVASLRYYIFSKELPVVLKAFVHGDGSLFNNYPELEEALVWVYFHSNLPEFNRVECWGPLREATSDAGRRTKRAIATTCDPSSPSPEDQQNNTPPQEGGGAVEWAWPQRCKAECDCCFPPDSLVPWPPTHGLRDESRRSVGQTQQ